MSDADLLPLVAEFALEVRDRGEDFYVDCSWAVDTRAISSGHLLTVVYSHMVYEWRDLVGDVGPDLPKLLRGRALLPGMASAGGAGAAPAGAAISSGWPGSGNVKRLSEVPTGEPPSPSLDAAS